MEQTQLKQKNFLKSAIKVALLFELLGGLANAPKGVFTERSGVTRRPSA